MLTLNFNNEWLNRTENKTPRKEYPNSRPQAVMWHETASPDWTNPIGTLNYNLPRRIESSYNYLIAWSGVPYHYVDEHDYISWSAGYGKADTGAGTFIDFDQNEEMIGVEMDLPNKTGFDGSAAQYTTAALLVIKFEKDHGIPIDRRFHIGHKEAAVYKLSRRKGRKTDPVSFSIDRTLGLALKLKAEGSTQMDLPAGTFPVDGRFSEAYNISGGLWRPLELTPGYARSKAIEENGEVFQVFDRGIARIRGTELQWLLLDEAIAFKQKHNI